MRQDIREMPIDEIRVLKVYRDLVPQPSAKDVALLRAEIKANGLDPARPLVVNGDLVLLDGHSRFEIAKDLGLQWVWVTVKELEDNWAEREFVIKSNLARRQLNTAQRAELGLKLLEIERERAKKRQQLAGQLYGRGQGSPSQEEFLRQWVRSLQEQALWDGLEEEKVRSNLTEPVNESDEKLVQNSAQPITIPQSQTGRSIDIVAQQVGVSRETIQRASVIQQAAQEDPEVATAWEDAKAGKTSVNQAYRQVRQARKVRIKDLPQTWEHELSGPFSLRQPPEPEPKAEKVWSDAEAWEILWQVAEGLGVSRESVKQVMETDKEAWFMWKQMLQDRLILEIGWNAIMHRVKLYEQSQIAQLAEEKPIRREEERLGPWALDRVHDGSLLDLVEEFPEERAHLVLTDFRNCPGLEEVELLAQFGQRALVPGKYLCGYFPIGLLDGVLRVMDRHGLSYRWTCGVMRPNHPDYHPQFTVMEVVNRWWMMLVFQKGVGRQYEAYEDHAGCQYWQLLPPGEDESRRDGVVALAKHHLKVLPLELIGALTAPGQLVVDPYVRDGGVMGLAALEAKRRYLLFHPDREQVLELDFKLEQEKRWLDRTRS